MTLYLLSKFFFTFLRDPAGIESQPRWICLGSHLQSVLGLAFVYFDIDMSYKRCRKCQQNAQSKIRKGACGTNYMASNAIMD